MEERVEGVIKSIIFFNDENNYTVFSIKLDYRNKGILKYRDKLFTDSLTILSYMDRKPLVGEEFVFYGDFITNQYGVQFKASRFERLNEQTLQGVVTFLSSNFFPGIGKATATKVFNTLGPECLSIIEKDRKVLNLVKGLTKKQKDIIYNNLFNYETNRKTLVSLLNMGFTMHTSLMLMKKLGQDVVNIIKTNPYSLMGTIEGFGFKRADKIALEIGIAIDSDIRLQALIVYILNTQSFLSGDVYFDYDDLYQECIRIVNKNDDVLTYQRFQEIINTLVSEKRIIIDLENNIYDVHLYNAEMLLAKKIKFFINRSNENKYNNNDIEIILKRVMKQNNIEYTNKQKEAIISSLSQTVTIITGGPGTGKSTIIKAIIECISLLGKNELIRDKIALIAPTGRAAKRLRELTAHEAITIHKFLGYDRSGNYRYGYNLQVDSRVVIVDEFSMVDIMLAARLFSSFPDDIRIILVGDADQLPSVSQGDVLLDLILCDEVPTVRLDQIHRQEAQSNIIELAHFINKGIIPQNITEKYNDRTFINIPDNQIISSINFIVEQALSRGMDLIQDIQILVPMYDGTVGINALNVSLQGKFNPNKNNEIKHMHRSFRINDKVLQLVNRSDKNIMNGDVGYILRLNSDNGKYFGLTVMFDVGSVDYTLEELTDLSHAYAMSIHKSQGSEYDLVIIPFSNRHYIMLKRKLIYTAITRAKKYLIMLGNINALKMGVEKLEKKRRTKLKERVNESNFIAEENKKDLNEMVNLTPYDFLN